MVPGVVKTILFSKTISLVSEPNNANGVLSIESGSSYPFAIPFPIYISGQNTPLPPSTTATNPGASVEVSYHVQVEISRKGMLRRNEV